MADSIDGSLVSMGQQFSGSPMDSLIGGPPQAAASARQGLVTTQAQYILNTGFNQARDKDGKIASTPITASIAMGRGQPVIKPDGSVATADSQLDVDFPIITMVPIPSLAVTSIDIAFDIEVNSSYTHETVPESSPKTQDHGSSDAKAGWGRFSIRAKGAVSHGSSQPDADTQS